MQKRQCQSLKDRQIYAKNNAARHLVTCLMHKAAPPHSIPKQESGGKASIILVVSALDLLILIGIMVQGRDSD